MNWHLSCRFSLLLHLTTGENYREEMLSKVVKFLVVGMAITVLQEGGRSEKSIARRRFSSLSLSYLCLGYNCV